MPNRAKLTQDLGWHDVAAGVSVAMVLIPQAMAYAELAGLPSQVGLFAAALPPLLAAPFVSSPYLQTGPVALTSLLTFGALHNLAEPFSTDYVALAALLALLVGAFRVALGAVGFGRIAYLLSAPVLTGFTTGAAILIVASQFPSVVGFEKSGDGVLEEAFTALTSPGDWELNTILFGVFTSALMVGGRRINTLFPGVLIAVIASTLISNGIDYEGSVIGELPGGFVDFRLDFPWGSAGQLLVAAIAIALVGFAEPSSIARAFATAERQPWDANREMLGQGVANIAAAISGGFPVGGSFSRSALNRTAGARTRWSGAVTGLVVLVSLPLTPLLEALPRAVLAALVITAVVKLIDLRRLWNLINESIPQTVVGVGTLVATLAFSPRVERGVLIGVGLAIGVHLYRELNDMSVDHDIDGTKMTVLPRGVLWFATVPAIERIVRSELAANPEVDAVEFDLGGVGRLDYTGGATLEQVVKTLMENGITISVCDVRPGAERAVRVFLTDALGIEPSHKTPE